MYGVGVGGQEMGEFQELGYCKADSSVGSRGVEAG